MQDPGLEAEALTHNEMLQVRDQLYDLERQLNSASRGEGEEVGADGRKAEHPRCLCVPLCVRVCVRVLDIQSTHILETEYTL